MIVMKKIFIILLVLAFVSASCKEWIDPGMNNDPNNPTDVGEAQLLAPV